MGSFMITRYHSPLGVLCLAAKDDALTGLWIEGQKYFPDWLQDKKDTMSVSGEDTALISYDGRSTIVTGRACDAPVLQQAKDWLDRYFAGEKPKIGELRLAPKGSAFRQAVWKILCEIPYGALTTYGKIAREVAKRQGLAKMSAQAAGGAIGHNPISIIIPCHRVVGANGSLTGYAGGIEKKIWLLKHEKAKMSGLFVPKKGTAL